MDEADMISLLLVDMIALSLDVTPPYVTCDHHHETARDARMSSKVFELPAKQTARDVDDAVS